jgi:nicotinate-nucleotide pyrophosphorylase (carboxylating)/molybdenum transport protein
MEKQVKLKAMRKIEIEPRTREEAYEFAPVADLLLLDHYSPQELESLVPDLRALNPTLEIAVGGIDLSMISEYAKLVDVIVTTAPYYSKPLDLTSRIRRI